MNQRPTIPSPQKPVDKMIQDYDEMKEKIRMENIGNDIKRAMKITPLYIKDDNDH